jgi:hypothetical protein
MAPVLFAYTDTLRAEFETHTHFILLGNIRLVAAFVSLNILKRSDPLPLCSSLKVVNC